MEEKIDTQMALTCWPLEYAIAIHHFSKLMAQHSEVPTTFSDKLVRREIDVTLRIFSLGFFKSVSSNHTQNRVEVISSYTA